MFKATTLFVAAVVLALGIPNKPTSTAGSWQVDTRHSDAQLKTDATTDYGRTKMDVTLGFARVRGRVNLDDADASKSSVNLSIYPATGMMPAIDEDGKFLSSWLADLSNHTLVCFHSTKVLRMPDGRVQATGNLVLTRVDRNLEATGNEAYAGPVYDPPMIHRVTREATLIFAPAASGEKQSEIVMSGSTSVLREDFPQLTKAVISTYWPPVVQDKNCQASLNGSEDYHGSQCTGTLLEAPPLPEEPHSGSGEDVGVPSNFNTLVGNHLNILVHLHLMERGVGVTAAGGN